MTLFSVLVPEEPEMHIETLQAFVCGIQRCDLPCRVTDLADGYQPCDVLVTFGVAKERTPRGRAIGEAIEAHQARHGDEAKHLVIERGFIHRDRYFMVGWGGLNGRADFRNAASPGDRWRALGVPIAPWRKTGRHIVLCGQVPWDASVQHYDHVAWCRDTASTLSKLTDRPIRFRPHPLQPEAVDMSGLPVTVSTAESLQDDMRGAWAVVTFNSNAGVEATLAGVPAFAADEGAMGYSILNKDLNCIESPLKPSRRRWCFDLAYTQWTSAEMAAGLPIMHLWHERRNKAPLPHRLATRVRDMWISVERKAA